MDKLTRVLFLKKHSPYNAGEQAGFEDSKAQGLVKHGIVKLVDKKPKSTSGNLTPDDIAKNELEFKKVKDQVDEINRKKEDDANKSAENERTEETD